MFAVAPEMATQPLGTAAAVAVCWVLQRYQTLVNVGAGEPVQVPLVEVRVEPEAATPVIVGATELAGGVPIAIVVALHRETALEPVAIT